MTKKRVLYLDHSAALGGGEIALLNLLSCLDRSSYKPVALLFADGPLVSQLNQVNVETHVLPLPDSIANTRKESIKGIGLLRLADGARLAAFIARLANLIPLLAPDLIHTNSLKSDFIGGVAGRMTGRPVLWHVRDRIAIDYIPRPAVHAVRIGCRFLADFVIANSYATLRTLQSSRENLLNDRSNHRVRVIHDGVTSAAFNAAGWRPSGRDGVTVGLVGRISPFKGQEIFIRAAAAVAGKFPDVRFKIIGSALFGENDYERSIRSLARDLGLEHKLEFTGFRNDIGVAIAELDILVHASITGEPFGQVIIEGMAAGKPVIATNGGGVPEIVVDGCTGLLVPMGDANAMALAIGKLINDPLAAVEMGMRGRARVEQNFRIENTVAKVQRFYHDIFARWGR